MGRRRALVLGSGGLTGLAWQVGVLSGLADAGVRLDADLVVGTSAGALLGAHLASGMSIDDLVPRLHAWSGRAGSIGWRAASALLAAQVYPSRRHALAWLGRRAARDWTPERSDAWVRTVAADLAGRDWPAPLVVVATDAATGRPAFLSSRQPADLATAVAASCAMPGVLPAVRIDGHLFLDGGLRSPANLDVAGSADVVVALAPLTGSVRAHRRPVDQAAQLRRAGVETVLLTPDADGRRAIGFDVLAPDRASAALAEGRRLGERHAAEVATAWAAGD
ncbi:MAG: patatin-like phospholipase family protein [Propionicimonas sp.]|uniref:patatin-like phospholipase family protein n=1 Tax=Propionicimonas sp. TaxID=1955623 RepID=UPI003D12CDC9